MRRVRRVKVVGLHETKSGRQCHHFSIPVRAADCEEPCPARFEQPEHSMPHWAIPLRAVFTLRVAEFVRIQCSHGTCDGTLTSSATTAPSPCYFLSGSGSSS